MAEPPTSSRPPSVEVLLNHPDLAAALDSAGRATVLDCIRAELDSLRKRIGSTQSWPDAPNIIKSVLVRVESHRRRFHQRVINGTGVLLHTNLGRAPWGHDLLDRISTNLTAYVSLEYDLEKGERGKRGRAVEAELAALAGAESALVVNNNAAAVYLVLSALAWNREVIISRGELVQIGGGFRIPEILARSGAVLREVGTTNQTAISDYERACGPQTALILKVHRSNFIQSGFVSEVDPKALASLGASKQIPVVWDIGSGAIGPGIVCEYSAEPTLHASVATGVDLVTASGDKLFGGPQAGIIIGKTALVERLRTDPFYRALRPDKSALLALEYVVNAHRSGKAAELIPLYQMLAMPLDLLKSRADNLGDAARKAGRNVEVVPVKDTFGGGSAPERTIDGWGIRFSPPPSADELAMKARQFDPPIIGTVSDGRF
ncbi:MAG: L-seryl-tRNA(Sec) selenium transferase, partial [candidate division Zixibacteria bacterium]|nr:L-seryl-tRNA(Sec) selenium transferase [candidate division Zixibacteria bacterium]